MLRGAFDSVDDEDVRLFYDYFEELKQHVRRFLHGKARQMPGESHVAQSALFSMFCDAAIQRLPLQDIDEYGYPMLWPLMLKYIERHCEKWKKYYRAKKRQGHETSLAASEPERPDFDPADYRSLPDDESAVGRVLASLYERLSPRQRRVADLTAQGWSIAEIAGDLDCSDSLVSIEKKNIRKLLETA
jgi:DNA-binding CsgD family transcriptional regulator